MDRTCVVVTGGNGFIGSHLVEALAGRGYELQCLVRKTSNLQWLQDVPVEFVYGDVTDAASLPDAVRGADYVYHLAGVVEARREEIFDRVNVQGTRNLLQAVVQHAPGLRRFVYTSSQSAAGPCSEKIPLDECDEPNPITRYGRSNLEAEKVVLSYRERVPVSIVRPPAVYGPRDTMILPYFKIVKLGIKPLLGMRHTKYMNLCYVGDLARGFILAAESEKAVGETYFIGDERAYSRAEVLDCMAEVLSVKAITVHVPDVFAHLLAGFSAVFGRFAKSSATLSPEKARELIAKYWICDVSKARRELGYESRVGLREGLRMTADWYREQGWL